MNNNQGTKNHQHYLRLDIVDWKFSVEATTENAPIIRAHSQTVDNCAFGIHCSWCRSPFFINGFFHRPKKHLIVVPTRHEKSSIVRELDGTDSLTTVMTDEIATFKWVSRGRK